jgi:WD40 repeat protein
MEVRDSMMGLRLNFLDGIRLIERDVPESSVRNRRRTFSMDFVQSPVKVQTDGLVLHFPFSGEILPHISPDICRLVLCIACNLARKSSSTSQNGFTIVVGNGAELMKDFFEKHFTTEAHNAMDGQIDDCNPSLFTGDNVVVVDGRTGRTLVSGVKVRMRDDVDDDGDSIEHKSAKFISYRAGKCFVVKCANGERGRQFRNLHVFYDNEYKLFKQEQLLPSMSNDGIGGAAEKKKVQQDNINYNQYNRFKLQIEPGWYFPILNLLVDRQFKTSPPVPELELDTALKDACESASNGSLDTKVRLEAIGDIAASAASLPILKAIMRDSSTQVAVKSAVLKAVERFHANEANEMVYSTVVDILATTVVHWLCKEDSGWTFLAEVFAAMSLASIRSRDSNDAKICGSPASEAAPGNKTPNAEMPTVDYTVNCDVERFGIEFEEGYLKDTTVIKGVVKGSHADKMMQNWSHGDILVSVNSIDVRGMSSTATMNILKKSHIPRILYFCYAGNEDEFQPAPPSRDATMPPTSSSTTKRETEDLKVSTCKLISKTSEWVQYQLSKKRSMSNVTFRDNILQTICLSSFRLMDIVSTSHGNGLKFKGENIQAWEDSFADNFHSHHTYEEMVCWERATRSLLQLWIKLAAELAAAAAAATNRIVKTGARRSVKPKTGARKSNVKDLFKLGVNSASHAGSTGPDKVSYSYAYSASHSYAEHQQQQMSNVVPSSLAVGGESMAPTEKKDERILGDESMREDIPELKVKRQASAEDGVQDAPVNHTNHSHWIRLVEPASLSQAELLGIKLSTKSTEVYITEALLQLEKSGGGTMSDVQLAELSCKSVDAVEFLRSLLSELWILNQSKERGSSSGKVCTAIIDEWGVASDAIVLKKLKKTTESHVGSEDVKHPTTPVKVDVDELQNDHGSPSKSGRGNHVKAGSIGGGLELSKLSRHALCWVLLRIFRLIWKSWRCKGRIASSSQMASGGGQSDLFNEIQDVLFALAIDLFRELSRSWPFSRTRAGSGSEDHMEGSSAEIPAFTEVDGVGGGEDFPPQMRMLVSAFFSNAHTGGNDDPEEGADEDNSVHFSHVATFVFKEAMAFQLEWVRCAQSLSGRWRSMRRDAFVGMNRMCVRQQLNLREVEKMLKNNLELSHILSKKESTEVEKEIIIAQQRQQHLVRHEHNDPVMFPGVVKFINVVHGAKSLRSSLIVPSLYVRNVIRVRSTILQLYVSCPVWSWVPIHDESLSSGGGSHRKRPLFIKLARYENGSRVRRRFKLNKYGSCHLYAEQEDENENNETQEPSSIIGKEKDLGLIEVSRRISKGLNIGNEDSDDDHVNEDTDDDDDSVLEFEDDGDDGITDDTHMHTKSHRFNRSGSRSSRFPRFVTDFMRLGSNIEDPSLFKDDEPIVRPTMQSDLIDVGQIALNINHLPPPSETSSSDIGVDDGVSFIDTSYKSVDESVDDLVSVDGSLWQDDLVSMDGGFSVETMAVTETNASLSSEPNSRRMVCRSFSGMSMEGMRGSERMVSEEVLLVDYVETVDPESAEFFADAFVLRDTEPFPSPEGDMLQADSDVMTLTDCPAVDLSTLETPLSVKHHNQSAGELELDEAQFEQILDVLLGDGFDEVASGGWFKNGQEIRIDPVSHDVLEEGITFSAECDLILPMQVVRGVVLVRSAVGLGSANLIFKGTSLVDDDQEDLLKVCNAIEKRVKGRSKGRRNPYGIGWNMMNMCNVESASHIQMEQQIWRMKLIRERVWNVDSVTTFFRRRYLLLNSAVEFFLDNGKSFFLNMMSEDKVKGLHKAILQQKPTLLRRNPLFKVALRKPPSVMRSAKWTKQWVAGEISNFEYLMHLNTAAGRTYNDLTQYPVFPWVIADYTSEKLDFTRPETFRDLTKPVGALNSNRLKRFMERYDEFEDPLIPKFMYGSHYSNLGAVLFYLIRMEPFTAYHLQLQNGVFDHADRLFSSIAQSWHVVNTSLQDVKELIPEFYYLPDFLVNRNRLPLGKTQSGTQLDDVELPPWASSPTDFVRQMNLALESDYVSCHLHNWVDLIFGYKQLGKAAVDAKNVFYHLTYEGAVDLTSITDDQARRALRDQIANFGQTPSKLFRRAHAQKTISRHTRKRISSTDWTDTLHSSANPSLSPPHEGSMMPPRSATVGARRNMPRDGEPPPDVFERRSSSLQNSRGAAEKSSHREGGGDASGSGDLDDANVVRASFDEMPTSVLEAFAPDYEVAFPHSRPIIGLWALPSTNSRSMVFEFVVLDESGAISIQKCRVKSQTYENFASTNYRVANVEILDRKPRKVLRAISRSLHFLTLSYNTEGAMGTNGQLSLLNPDDAKKRSSFTTIAPSASPLKQMLAARRPSHKGADGRRSSDTQEQGTLHAAVSAEEDFNQRTFLPHNSCHLCVGCGALVCVGFADHSVRIVALATGHVSQTILHHSDVVTCVSFSDDGTFVAFGSADCTVSIWEGIPTDLVIAESIRPTFQHSVFSAQRFRRPVISHTQADKDTIPAAVQLSPCHVLHGHTAPITSVVIDQPSRLAISGASDNTCLIHCLDSGR